MLQRKQYLHGPSKPSPTGRRAVSSVPNKAAHPGARALALCPEAASDQEAWLLPLLSISGCLAPDALPTECPRCFPVSPWDSCSFLPGSVPWRGYTLDCNPPHSHPNDHFHWLCFKTEDPWLSPVTVTAKATPSGGGIAGTQPRPHAVGHWAGLTSEMSHVPFIRWQCGRSVVPRGSVGRRVGHSMGVGLSGSSSVTAREPASATDGVWWGESDAFKPA